jgi:NADP-dependent 3-hydroxy acid dehydrogenase YdfG
MSQETKGFALITGASSGIGDHEDDGRWRASVQDILEAGEG